MTDDNEAHAREWNALCEKDDRTSPVDYPDMAIITFAEFSTALDAAEARGRIAGLKEAKAIYQEGSVSGQDGKHDWWDTFLAYTNAIDARLASITAETTETK